jgi:hypothetical protein
VGAASPLVVKWNRLAQLPIPTSRSRLAEPFALTSHFAEARSLRRPIMSAAMMAPAAPRTPIMDRISRHRRRLRNDRAHVPAPWYLTVPCVRPTARFVVPDTGIPV